ncbi:UNVERIFIED_CONTAM: hypothetical protein HDU68_010177 [Siphonaria sp. JEL0065]|nr:hypothetical protein HDU68_010177 [Siphonaria sp. JEL0065]
MDKVKTAKVHKRVPQRKPTLESDVFVSRKSNFKALVKRCETRLKKDNHVVVHGLGAAVSKAVSVALAVQEALTDIVLDTTTSTVNLIDDLIDDLDEDKDDTVNERKNSAIHIRISKRVVHEGDASVGSGSPLTQE